MLIDRGPVDCSDLIGAAFFLTLFCGLFITGAVVIFLWAISPKIGPCGASETALKRKLSFGARLTKASTLRAPRASAKVCYVTSWVTLTPRMGDFLVFRMGLLALVMALVFSIDLFGLWGEFRIIFIRVAEIVRSLDPLAVLFGFLRV